MDGPISPGSNSPGRLILLAATWEAHGKLMRGRAYRLICERKEKKKYIYALLVLIREGHDHQDVLNDICTMATGSNRGM